MTNNLAFVTGAAMAAMEISNAGDVVQMLGTLSGTGLLIWIVLHKHKEAEKLREENRQLTRDLGKKCVNCELAKAANDFLTDHVKHHEEHH